jgi:ribosomal protein S18 acetylase RimI-like enzyme
VIRIATQDDLPLLSQLFGRPAMFADCLERQRTGRGLLLLAVPDDVLVGHLFVRWEPADEPEVRDRLPGVPLLQHFAVLPSRRNRGTGTELFEFAERLLTQRGYPKVALGVGTENHAAVRLYERLGFTEWPYPPVATTKEEYLPDGSRRHTPELCRIFVKGLSGTVL